MPDDVVVASPYVARIKALEADRCPEPSHHETVARQHERIRELEARVADLERKNKTYRKWLEETNDPRIHLVEARENDEGPDARTEDCG